MDLFAQIYKVDEARREVWGRAAQEVPDHSAEILDYDSSKPFFEKWSAEVSEATNGKSLGNIRSMHGNVAAGKVIQIEFDDVDKAIDIGTKIIDDNEWQKVLEGVHSGFSIGGRYVKSWNDGDLKRYTAEPNEVSLVDRPCIPTAKFFDIRKADGSTMQQAFKNQEAAQMEKSEEQAVESVSAVDELADMLNKGIISPEKLVELAKVAARDDVTDADKKDATDKYGDVDFADKKNKKYPIDTEEHIRAAWSRINQEKNEEKYSADDLKEIKDAIIAAWKDKIDKDGPPSEAEKMDNPHLKKGMYSVATLAQLLDALSSVQMAAQYEADCEQDDSPVPDQLKSALAQLGAVLVAMTTEEVAELTEDSDTPDVEPMAMSDKGDLAKVGARNSAEDQSHLQAAHDHLVSMGAACGATTHPGNDTAKDPDEMGQDNGNKDVTATQLKAEASGDLLKAAVDENTMALMKTITDLEARLKKIESMPAPRKGELRVVDKHEDGMGELKKQEINSTPGQHNPEAALAMIKQQISGSMKKL